MVLPSEVPVMVLPEATLFPGVILPLYIFEPRYRRMLADVLQGERMFSVAMRRTASPRSGPSPIAGLGLVRACVRGQDGTSHLVLQGLCRIELGKAVRHRPYRVHQVRPLAPPDTDNVVIDALVAKVRELINIRLVQVPKQGMDHYEEHVRQVQNPGELADFVSGTLLSHPGARQVILESVDLERRLKHLIHFLLADIEQDEQQNPP
jgi:Lon protease-like protein